MSSTTFISRSFQLGEQGLLVDLSHARAREWVGAHLDAAGELVVGEAVGEKGAHVVDAQRRGVVAQAHYRTDVLAENLVGDADGGGFDDVRMRMQAVLDLDAVE